MSRLPPKTVSKLLANWQAGDDEALRAVVRLVYDELRRLVQIACKRNVLTTLCKAPLCSRPISAIEKAMVRLRARCESDPAGFLISRITEWKAARGRDEAAGRFVPNYPYPATWFNEERYDAESLQPAKNCVLPDGKLGTAAELQAQTGWQVIRGAV